MEAEGAVDGRRLVVMCGDVGSSWVRVFGWIIGLVMFRRLKEKKRVEFAGAWHSKVW